MDDYENSICNERLWVIALLACNVASLALGVIIFGLSLGTIKHDIFEYDVWQFLAPVFQIACADIACGVFMWVTSGIGLCFLNFRRRLLGKLYSVILVTMFIYQLSIGVATIIIGDEKMEYVRAVAVILCVDPGLKSWTKTSTSNPAIEGDTEVFDLSMASARLASRFETSPLDKLYANNDPAPPSAEECNYFVNVSTPCGALLVCSSVLYLYMLYCAHCLRDSDKRYQRKADNVIRRALWQENVLGSADTAPSSDRRVQFQEKSVPGADVHLEPVYETPNEGI